MHSVLATGASQSFQLEDFDKIAELSAPAFSLDGESLAYVVTTSNLAQDKMASDIWRVSWDGRHRTPLTSTPTESEWQPLWSPDGKWLAFLSDRGEHATTQVWLMPSNGGEAARVTSFKGAVSEFVWSPDSRRLGVIAQDAVADVDAKDAAEKTPPIVIERFSYKNDEDGYLSERRSHIYVVDLSTRKQEQITSGKHDEQLLSWSPDGKLLAYVTKRGNPDRHVNFDIYVVAPQAGATERQITVYEGIDSDPYWETKPAWSPNSKYIAYLQGGEQKWVNYAPGQLAIVAVATRQTRVPANIDRAFYRAKWSADGKSIYTLIEQSRNTYLASVNVATGAVHYLSGGQRFDLDVDIARNGRIALLGGDDHHPPALFAVEKTLRPMSAHNEWLDTRALANVEDLEFSSRDGTQIHAMLLRPVGYLPGKRYPTILRLHGGPVYQFSHEFMAEWQYYAAQGFAVVVANPRGSSGRGFEFAKAIYADWGNKDAQDVLAAADHVVKLGVADPNRLVIGGWSYGAILTNYVLAQDGRFKAAFSGAGSSNALAMYGHDQYVREYEFELGKPWENADAYLRLSTPFLHADRIKTPTLFLCAQLDNNVPCLGAEQMYQALQSENVPTRLIIYPEQHHALDVPSYIRHRMHSYVEWARRFFGN